MKFNPDQIALIKQQIAPAATDNELKLFIYAAQRYGLDPLQRQIFCIHRNESKLINGNWVKVPKMTIQTSIDGFRIVAERSGEYGGQGKPVFTYDSQGNLEAAEVTVYRFRGDTRYPVAVGEAYLNEYQQTNDQGKPTGLWAKMPRTMLAKCAEALALRKAFPQQLSGLYTDDEMSQQNNYTEPAQELKAEVKAQDIVQKQVAAPAMTTVIPPADKKQAEKIPVKKATQAEKPKMTQADLEAIEREVAASVLPGEWYARTEKIRTKKELMELYMKYKGEVDASEALKNLFKETEKGLTQ